MLKFSHIDCVFVSSSFFWRLFGTNTIQQQLIKSFWPEAPDNIDAAYENTVQDRLLLIKGMSIYIIMCNDHLYYLWS